MAATGASSRRTRTCAPGRARTGICGSWRRHPYWKLSGGRKVAVAKRGPLSGVIYDVATEPDGGFWIGSSTGLAHYAPPAWRTPAEVEPIDQPVHGIAEDRQGRVWFAATEYLLELDGSTWRIHQLPDDLRTQTFLTSSLAPLADGRIAFMALEVRIGQRSYCHLRPAHRRIPPGEPQRATRNGVFAGRRDATTAWVQTTSPCRLAIWDGQSMVAQPDIRRAGLCDKLRMVYQASDGADSWMGTTAQGGGIFRRGTQSLVRFGPKQGYPEDAVYSFFEAAPGVMMVGGRNALAEWRSGSWKTMWTGMDAVRSMIRSRDGAIWVAAGSGVHRRKGDAWFINGEAEGLPSDTAYVVFEDSRGRLWAGTSRGLSRFDAAADRDAPKASLAGSNTEETLPDGNVTLAFSGVDRWRRTLPERLLFSYRMDSGRWSDFGSATTATFKRLSRGPHRFEVRAMDRSGNISPPADSGCR